MIFERHESLPMASGSVALSGAMGELNPEVKVGSIVLIGGTIEQALEVRAQPSPIGTDVAKQLHVKPPIVIESTSPAANKGTPALVHRRSARAGAGAYRCCTRALPWRGLWG